MRLEYLQDVRQCHCEWFHLHISNFSPPTPNSVVSLTSPRSSSDAPVAEAVTTVHLNAKFTTGGVVGIGRTVILHPIVFGVSYLCLRPLFAIDKL
jgi:hypothetical protein